MSPETSAERQLRVKVLFQDALDVPAARRAAFLARACGGDDELRREVLELFLLHGEQDSLLDQPLDHAEALADLAAPREGFVGPYRLVREIGRGGMGVVHLAEREGREVALKLLSVGALTPELRDRFRLEGKILRRLDHPGLARVLDVGESVTTTGLEQPWIAMEYVEGRPLIEHAEASGLDLQGRLRLMLAVCEAVQHAHARDVVHRDLKPSNILVREDGRPVVLDFGVARLVAGDERLTELHTRTGELLGTPQYMSPEQVQAAPAGVGPESDVYSLGIVLYQLVSGQVPYEASSLSLHRAVVSVLTSEPVPLGQVSPAARGPLDRIVMMALEKLPRDRYADAGQLADDLRRRLDGRTVRARGPSLARRFVRWSRREQRLAISLALLVVAGALAGAWFLGGGRAVPQERVRAAYREAESLSLSSLAILYERERTPDTMRDAIAKLTRARQLIDEVPPLSHHDFLMRRIEKDLGTAQMLLGDLTWDVGLARQAIGTFLRARAVPFDDDSTHLRDRQTRQLVGLPAADDELMSLLAGANLLTFRLWGELATIEAAEDLARQAFDENLRMMGTPLGPDFATGDPRRDRVGYLFNNLVEIEAERAWFYQDAALARRAVEWSDSARSRWESFHDNWPAIGSVLFQRARAWHALGALTRNLAPLDSAEAALRASADYRGPGRARVFAETREARASLALDRSALEPEAAKRELLLRSAIHDLDTARVSLAAVGAIPEQLAALRSAQAEVFTAMARVTRSGAWLDSARTRLSETAALFPHTGFPREASLHWMRQGLWETARADLYADPTSVVAARGAFEHARSLSRSRRDRTILARVDAAERSLEKLPLASSTR
jgi:predicted Ser/Thr protein kinase/tetratricopeptide (TPR) repeat protein